MFRRELIFLLLLAAPALPLFADPKIPQITYLFPSGAQRGASPEVTIGGQFLQEAFEVRVSRPGVSALVEKSAADRLEAKFCVQPAAEPGRYEIRIRTPRGISNTMLFTVGSLKDYKESEPNNVSAKANPITPPLTVHGKIEPGEDMDFFRLRAQSGERLIFDLDASRSGSALDASLTLMDESGRELAFNEDFYTWDPALDYTFAQAGDYWIRVRGIGGRGSADFTYRLHIHGQPSLDYMFPLGGRRGESIVATLAGRLLQNSEGAAVYARSISGAATGPPTENQATVRLDIPSEAPLGTVELHLEKQDYLSNALRFDIGDLPEKLEVEPNNQGAEANPVIWPAVINGRLESPDELDHFKFSVKKGERLHFEIRARQLGSLADTVLTMFDSKGRELAANDDPVAPSFNEPANWDAKLSYRFPADGEYIVQVREVAGRGGAGYPYRLLIRPAAPGFLLKVTPENPAIEKGKEEKLTVSLVRTEGFEGDVRLEVLGLPEGVSAGGPLQIAAKENRTTIDLEAGEPVKPGLTPIKIMGRATFEERLIEREAIGVIKLPRVSGQDILRMPQELTLNIVESPPAITVKAAEK